MYRQVCVAVDRLVIEAALRYAKGNQVQASELLGISRTTLRSKMKSLGMFVEKQTMLEGGDGSSAPSEFADL